MKRPAVLILLLLIIWTQRFFAQNDSQKKQLEIGLDLFRFNKDWIYYKTYDAILTKDFIADAIPSIFVRIPVKNSTLRIKYEFYLKHYLFKTNGFDYSSTLDSKYYHNRMTIGLQRPIIDKRFKLLTFLDFGLSLMNYSGINASSSQGVPAPNSPDPFNINSIGVSLQPGLGIKYRIFNELSITIESAIILEKGFETEDHYSINPENKLIPRPLNMVGISYSFLKNSTQTNSTRNQNKTPTQISFD